MHDRTFRVSNERRSKVQKIIIAAALWNLIVMRLQEIMHIQIPVYALLVFAGCNITDGHREQLKHPRSSKKPVHPFYQEYIS